MPARWNNFAVSVLPMPMEPVSPMTKGRFSVTAERLFEFSPQYGRNFRRYTEPKREARDRLVHQHAQPVHRLVSARVRLSEEIGLQGIVDDVRNASRIGQCGEIDVERRLASH